MGAQAGHGALQIRAALPAPRVALDILHQIQDGGGGPLKAVVVQSQTETTLDESLHAGDGDVVHVDGLDDLQDDLPGREGERVLTRQEGAGHVHERQPCPDEVGQAELEERVHQDARCGLIGVCADGGLGGAVTTEQQLVPDNGIGSVDDGLSPDVHIHPGTPSL